MKRIVLLNCYFGEFPWYFSLFLKSCGCNISVDFIIFSDCKNRPVLPENVRIIPFAINDFNFLATKKLGFDIAVKSAYKLCDFKPAYGLIFSEYLTDYDFWGMTDIDIVFGRIREFMTEELLENYDVISVRNDYPTGSFMLFKNYDVPNNLFKKSKDFKKIFQSDTHYCFDECNFKHNFLQEGGNIKDIYCEIESMHHIILKEIKNNSIQAHFDFLVIEGIPGQLEWKNGLLSFKDEFEVLLYHLILYKSNVYTRKKNWKIIPNNFFIDKYVLRRNDLNTLLGKIAYFYFNKLRPIFYKVFNKINYTISNKMNFNVKKLNIGFYELNGMWFQVIQNSLNHNLILFNGTDKGRQMIKSMIFKNEFFIKNHPHTRYVVEENGHYISAVSINGNINKFKKVN